MYEIVNAVLNKGDYNLVDILKKIDSLWIQGKLTDEQHTQLIVKARDGADVNESIDVLAKLEELDKRLIALENGDTPSEDVPVEEYPEYVPGKWYYQGDKCAYEGKNYICIAPANTVCTWSPSEYPNYWEAA